MPRDDVNHSRGLDINRHNPNYNIPNADDDYTLANMADAARGSREPSPRAPANDDIVEITAPQKMISAMSGSLLTSLLGALRVPSTRSLKKNS
jgi:hypothetical protein